MSTLTERIKKLRRSLDLTQQEFADKLGTTRNNIAGYEIGRRSPSEAVISLICKTFNVSDTWLRTGAGEMFVEAPSDTLDALVREYHLDRFGRAVVEKMLNLNEKQWAVFQDFAMDVLESLSDGPAVPAPAQPAQDIASEIADLKLQNQEKDKQLRELAAKVAAMEKEDDKLETAPKSSTWPSASAGNFNSVKQTKK